MSKQQAWDGVERRRLPQGEADSYRKKLVRALTPAIGVFKHFATPEQEQEHLRQVREAQDAGQVPF